MPREPKFDPARRNARVGPQQLPAEGRKGRAPAWPLAGRKRGGEEQLWKDLWSTPQATVWERLGWTRTVARYCRVVNRAEQDLDSALLSEARQLEDRLGLTPKSMRLMLWTIVGDTVAEARAAKREQEKQEAASRETSNSARDRIRLVDSDGA